MFKLSLNIQSHIDILKLVFSLVWIANQVWPCKEINFSSVNLYTVVDNRKSTLLSQVFAETALFHLFIETGELVKQQKIQ